MTDQEINIAIAEACGVNPELISKWLDWKEAAEQFRNSEINFDEYYRRHLRVNLLWSCPNYCRDLNAMHDAEKTRICYDPEIQETYSEQLLKAVLETYGYQGARMVLHASAHQRAKAFLRTLHLWKE
jgi:hypothetical protein